MSEVKNQPAVEVATQAAPEDWASVRRSLGMEDEERYSKDDVYKALKLKQARRYGELMIKHDMIGASDAALDAAEAAWEARMRSQSGSSAEVGTAAMTMRPNEDAGITAHINALEKEFE